MLKAHKPLQVNKISNQKHLVRSQDETELISVKTRTLQQRRWGECNHIMI